MTDVVAEPFVEKAYGYFEAGWPVLPVPPRRKKTPPAGFTGDDGVDPTLQQVERWLEERPPDSNIVIRMPEGVIGLDIDAYKPEGAQSLATLVAECGALPPTWTITSRDDGVSGIRLYKVPPGTILHGVPPGLGGIEVLQRHHRYAVTWPSIHPDTGAVYRIIGPDAEATEIIPKPAELVDLPSAWLQRLRKHERVNGTPVERHHAGEWSPCVTRIVADAVAGMTKGSRHDTALKAAAALARYEQLEHPGAAEALDALARTFTSAIADRADDRAAAKEWNDIVTSGRDLVASTNSAAPTWEHRIERKDLVAFVAGLDPPSTPNGHQSLLDNEPDSPHSSWEPVDLAPIVAGLVTGTLEIPQPTVGEIADTGKALFYLSRVNGLYGPSGDGKTWIANIVAREQLHAGHTVWWIDFEDDEIGTVDRMLDLDTDPTAITERFRYIRPDERLTVDAQASLYQRLELERPTVITVDSAGEWLGQEGVDTDRDHQVAKWIQTYIRGLTRAGSAVILIDHVPHDHKDILRPIGSQRKKAAITGSAFMVTALAELGRDRIGKLRLITAKDRRGFWVRGKPAAELLLDATTHPYTANLTPPTETRDDDDHDGLAGQSPAIRRVARALNTIAEPATVRRLGDVIAQDGDTGTGLKRRTIQDALRKLETIGRAHSPGIEPDGNGALWLSGPHPALQGHENAP